MSNSRRTVLYIGVTNSLDRRMLEHIHRKTSTSFTAKYNLTDLIYYESYSSIDDAIRREKVLKGWTRKRKEVLIHSTTPFPHNGISLCSYTISLPDGRHACVHEFCTDNVFLNVEMFATPGAVVDVLHSYS